MYLYHYVLYTIMSLVVLLITECHNGDDFFVWAYDDVGLYSQSPKMVRPETRDKAVTHCVQLYSIVDIAIHCRMAEYFFGEINSCGFHSICSLLSCSTLAV